MEILLVILILVVWITLYSHISKMSTHIDSLKKEIGSLKKIIESHSIGIHQELKGEAEVKMPEMLPETALNVVQERKVAPPVIAPFGPVKKQKKKIDYEKYIGENLFGKIGILVLVVGMGLFVKYAIDNNWINEVFRTILGFVVGAGLLLLSWWLKNTYRAFSSLLAGGAFAIFYVTVSMAYHYYGLFNQIAAFVILVILTVFMSLLAVFYNRRELAVIALIGGFISPFLVSNGMGSYLVLFTYLSILNLGMFGLSLYKKWGELPVICFVSTYVIMFGYSLVADLDIARSTQLIHLLLFSTLFYLIFLLPVVSIMQTDNKKVYQSLTMIVVLNNFLYLYFALWYLDDLQLTINLKGTFTLFIALVNGCIAFAVRGQKEDKSTLFTALIGMVLTFLSITIPVQLEGSFITLLWATEMVVVLWLFIKSRLQVYAYFAIILIFLTMSSFLIDIENTWRGDIVRPLLVNGAFATSLFTSLAFGIFAWVMERKRELFEQTTVLKYTPFSAISWLAGCGLLYISFMVDFYVNISDRPLSECVCLAFTGLTLFMLLVGLRKRFPVGRYAMAYAIGAGLAVCLFILLSRISNNYAEVSLWLLQWGMLLVLGIHLFFLTKWYYALFDLGKKGTGWMVSFVTILSTVLLAVAVNNGLHVAGLQNESSAALSISLSVAGFIQMSLGMRLHLKLLRMISLAIFGLVLLKLVIVDLWLLPTVGKIIVFIMLGVILLVLSFLYQKLKKVLFMDNREE